MARMALVTLEYPPDHGGIASYLSGLVRASQGDIDVFVPVEHNILAEQKEVRSKAFFAKGIITWMPLIKLFRELSREYSIFLISHYLPAGTAAWITSWFRPIRYVIFLHGLDILLAQKSFRRAWISTRILRRADKVFANSEWTKKLILDQYPSIPVTVLLPAIEKQNLPEKAVSREKFSIKSEEIIILCLSRLVRRKGIDRLFDIIDQLPSYVRLIIVGDGPERERLLHHPQANDYRITFVFNCSDEEKFAWFSASDIYAVPGREKEDEDDVEGFGVVFLEAAFAGLPSIGGRTGGVGEAIVDGQTGFLVSDDRELLSALQQLISQPDLRQRMGEAGKQRVEQNFLWSQRHQEFIREMKMYVT